MSARLWYPQLDLYDGIRRVSALLFEAGEAVHLERLHILDFFLANPTLLHRTTMTREMRLSFSKLGIVKPEKSFLAFPAAPLLFHQMEAIQEEAIRSMVGKGLLSTTAFHKTVAELTDRGRRVVSKSIWPRLPASEIDLVFFLTRDFSGSQEDGLQDLRNRTGLRRAAR
jgi:hypothetical protein